MREPSGVDANAINFLPCVREQYFFECTSVSRHALHLERERAGLRVGIK